jgi:hypothetical protein
VKDIGLKILILFAVPVVGVFVAGLLYPISLKAGGIVVAIGWAAAAFVWGVDWIYKWVVSKRKAAL